MKRRSKLYLLAVGLLGLAVFTLSSCNDKLVEIEGRSYNYQCYWDGGPNDFSPYGEFNAGGVLVHHDDTATITGTWSNVEETVIWTLNNPPKNTRFRGTFDKKGIAGNITDDLGGTGIFQGAAR
jgi:hypothetical protein